MKNMGERTNGNNVKHVDGGCKICLESLQVDNRTPVRLRCGHLYHLGKFFVFVFESYEIFIV